MLQNDSKEYGRPKSLAIKIEPKGNGPLFTEITVFQRMLKSDLLAAWQECHSMFKPFCISMTLS